MRNSNGRGLAGGSTDGEKPGKAGGRRSEEQKYPFAVKARFGGEPVLVTVGFAEQLRTGAWRDNLELEVYEPAAFKPRSASLGR